MVSGDLLSIELSIDDWFLVLLALLAGAKAFDETLFVLEVDHDDDGRLGFMRVDRDNLQRIGQFIRSELKRGDIL